MLPPVRATLSSIAEYQVPSQQPLLRQRIDVASNADSAGMVSSTPLTGGRLDIMSLSAQLQLSQGFSVFAETIGKLIKLPRREGEALVDYARRLMEAVQSMTPAQQVALERMLNQLVKGVSLKLLAQILADPDGPEAARFALKLETAQLLDRDLAAKAVVSSYRQNAGSELVPGAPPRIGGAAPAVPGQPPATAPAAQPAQTPVHEAAVQQQATAQQPEPAEAGDAASPRNETRAAAQQENSAPAEHAAPGSASASPAAASSAAASPSATSIPLPTDAEIEAAFLAASQDEIAAEADVVTVTAQEVAAEIAESETPAALEVLSDEMPETPVSPEEPESAGQEEAAAEPHEARRNATPVVYDGLALARASQRGLDQAALTMPRPMAGADRAQATAVAEWLAEVFADGNVDMLEPLPETARILPEQLALEELLQKEMLDGTIVQGGKITGSNPMTGAIPHPSEDVADPAASALRPAVTSANPAGPAADVADLAEQLVLPLALPQILRDGVAMPYVVYPPEERERDPEERKAKPVAETDEDGEQQHAAGDQAFHDNRGEEQSQNDDDGEQASGEHPEDEGRPNDLYWRMAGWA